jgi:TolB-like protein/class 3 adenylate cyclase
VAQERVERRLAAILVADVVGYSRLVGMDEEGTIARLNSLRKELIDPSIAKHHGRIVKTTGDGVLVEFPSVVDAVRNAVEVQRALAEREAVVPEDRRIEFRVGVNSGDIIVQGDDILGDGVNVAARLEGLAKPGGICIPRKVFHEVRNKLDVGYEYIGEQKVKNIETPVPVYRVLLDPEAAGQIIGEKRPSRPRWQVGTVVAAAVAVIAVAVMAVWWQPWVERVETASVERMAYPLPYKPSIAVLPFDNLSGDPKQDLFVDGFTENIITALAKVPKLFVIARNSTFTYKGKPVKVQKVAEELGVQYVLEGSVQRSGGTIRITAQLIDALSGKHVWAERYDRGVKDVFVLQDEITLNILTALQVTLTEGEQARMQGRTDNLEAYLQYLKALARFRRFRREDNQRARELSERAIELDPDYASAWVLQAWTHQMDGRFGWSESRADSYKRAAEIARKRLAVDDMNRGVHTLLSGIYRSQLKFDESLAAGRKAIALAPSVADGHAVLAVTTYYAGDFEETVALTKEAMRLNPHYPTWYLYRIGVAYRMLGRYEEAVDALEANKDRQSKPNLAALTALTATYAMMGRTEDARAVVAETLALYPKATVRRAAKMHYFKDPAHLERILAALRKAGLPE